MPSIHVLDRAMDLCSKLESQIKQSNQPQVECAAVLMGKEGLLTPGGSREPVKYPTESGTFSD